MAFGTVLVVVTALGLDESEGVSSFEGFGFEFFCCVR